MRRGDLSGVPVDLSVLVDARVAVQPTVRGIFARLFPRIFRPSYEWKPEFVSWAWAIVRRFKIRLVWYKLPLGILPPEQFLLDSLVCNSLEEVGVAVNHPEVFGLVTEDDSLLDIPDSYLWASRLFFNYDRYSN